MEVILKTKSVEVSRSDRGCITTSYDDPSVAINELTNELISAKKALISAWTDAFFRSGTYSRSRESYREIAFKKYKAEIING